MKRSISVRDYQESPKEEEIEIISEDNEGIEKKDPNESSNKTADYIRDLDAERSTLKQNELPIAARLVDQEISKVQSTGRFPPREYKYVNIYREKPIKITSKVLVPVLEHPRFNFVGKLLGPKGNSLKRLQEDTMCKMSILGKGSMKDPLKEEELKKSGDPKYTHLSEDLYVEISAFGPPAEAYARMSYALAEVRKYLIPDKNDSIRQEQLRELESITGSNLGGLRSSYNKVPPLMKSATRDSIQGPPPLMRSATREPVISTRVMPARVKIMSILDRARLAMEESYSFDEPIGTGPHNAFSSYESPPSPVNKFEEADFPVTYYRKKSSPGYEEPFHRGKSSEPVIPSRHAETSRYRMTSHSRAAMKDPY